MAAQVRLAAPGLGGYIAARALGLLVLWAMARHFHAQTFDLLGKWDGRWFLGIVEHGYDTTLRYRPDGSLVNTNIVFFPGYPYLVKAIATVTGLSALHAGIAASWLSGLLAAWGLFAVGNHLYGRTVGVLLAVLWGIQTHAIVESMVYSEGLFTGLAAWCLYAVLRRRWLTAGTLCALAGATRAAAVVLVAVVVVGACAAVVRGRGGWRPLAGALIAPVGLVSFLAWVASELGRFDGWYYMEGKGWYSEFDAGAYTYRILVNGVLTKATWLEFYEVGAVLIASLALLILLVFLRPPWPLSAYAAGMLVLVLGTKGYYHAKARLLLPAFPLLLPIAVGLARAPRSTLAVLLPPLGLASAWYGAYLLLLWHASP